MRELIAGEGGSVLVAASVAPDAVAFACEGLAHETSTPSRHLRVFPTDGFPEDIRVGRVRLVACETRTRDVIAAWAARRHIELVEDETRRLARPDGVRVVAVSAPSTASGKTALVRRIAKTLSRSGVRVAVARHPIANLLLWERFGPVVVRTPPELGRARPLEEREEIAPVIGTGVPVVSGLDPERTLRLAAHEAGEGGVVLWDGGGAAEPWIETDMHFVAIDLLRPPGDEAGRRVGSADVVVLTKADSADAEVARQTERKVRDWNLNASVVLADLAVGVQPGKELTDRRVVIVEDWAGLVLGGLVAGAGAVAARRFRCTVVEPRPFAVGAISEVFDHHPHIGPVIPSLGRTADEIDDLAASVRATPGEAVLWASNADPLEIIGDERRPIIRAFGELTEVAGPSLQQLLEPLLPGRA